MKLTNLMKKTISVILFVLVIGAVIAVSIVLVGSDNTFAYWETAQPGVESSFVSNSTALADTANASEKYLVLEYYADDNTKIDTTGVKTTQPESLEDNLYFNKVAGDNGMLRDTFADYTNVAYARVIAYVGNIDTLWIPDTVPITNGTDWKFVPITQIGALNEQNSPGVAVVKNLIIGAKVDYIGYTDAGHTSNGGMYGFKSLEKIIIYRDEIDTTKKIDNSTNCFNDAVKLQLDDVNAIVRSQIVAGQADWVIDYDWYFGTGSINTTNSVLNGRYWFSTKELDDVNGVYLSWLPPIGDSNEGIVQTGFNNYKINLTTGVLTISGTEYTINTNTKETYIPSSRTGDTTTAQLGYWFMDTTNSFVSL